MTGLPRLPEPPFRRAVPTTPADRAGAHVDYFPAHAAFPTYPGGSASALSLSRPAQALLALRPAESLSRPQATFVTRLRPFRLPGRAARQLPDQSTTFRMESSSTDGSRLRGAQGNPDISQRPAPGPSLTPERTCRLPLRSASRCASESASGQLLNGVPIFQAAAFASNPVRLQDRRRERWRTRSNGTFLECAPGAGQVEVSDFTG
jgi:hypothetical protein